VIVATPSWARRSKARKVMAILPARCSIREFSRGKLGRPSSRHATKFAVEHQPAREPLELR